MRKFRNGRILGLILTAAMFITSVPADVLAVEDLVLSEDVTLEDVNTEETAEPVAAAPENATQTTEDMILGEPEGDVSVALDDVVEDNTSADVTLADDVISDDVVSDGIIQDGAVLEEDADTLSADEVTRDMDGDALDRLKGYIRDGRKDADPDSVALYDSSLEEKELGVDAYGQVYTYTAGGKPYTVLYIWGTEAGTKVVLEGGYGHSYITSDTYYGDLAKNTITDLIMDDSIASVTTDRAFFQMKQVSYVRLSKTLESLGESIFEECTSIPEITIPASLSSVGGSLFDDCSSLTTLNFDEGMSKIPKKMATSNSAAGVFIQTVNFPESVKIIDDLAFTNLIYLTTVNYAPGTVLQMIGDKAFFNTNLESITLPRFGGKWYDDYDTKKKFPQVPVVSGLAFAANNNKDCHDLIIPEGVGKITQLVNGTEKYYKDIYLPKSIEKKGIQIDTFSGITDTSSIKHIYYAGSKAQFYAALGQSEKDALILGEPYWHKIIQYNVSAPVQVSGINVPSDKTTIVKYLDDISSDPADPTKDTIELTVSPANHFSNTKYSVESSDTTIVEAKLDDETEGKLPLTLTYNKKKTDEPVNVTVKGGQASTTIKVIIKDKDQVKPLKFKINGNFATLSESEVKKGDWIVAESDTRDCVIKYKVGSGEAKEYPNGGLTVGSEDLFKNAEEGEEITVTAQAFKEPDLKPSDAVTIKLINKLDMGDVLPADLAGLDPRIIPEGLWIPEWCYSKTPEYNGSAIALSELKVFWYNKLLRKGKDYTVKYANNIDATSKSGKNATVTVTCKGSYSGTLTKEFVINNLTLTDSLKSRYSFTPVTLAYKEGLEQTADIGFVFDGRKLALGKDYSVKYRDSEYNVFDKVVAPGKYTVVINGEGNYTGGFPISNAICVVDTTLYTSMEDVKVSKIKPQQIQKINDLIIEAVIPQFTVTYNGQTITADSGAFEVSYEKNNEAGAAKLILTGKEKAVSVGDKTISFQGTKVIPFTIKPMNVKKATVTLPNQTYTGEAHIPIPTVTIDGNPVSQTYYKWSFKNNIKAGTASVTVAGKGPLSGKKTVKFKISKADLSTASVTCPPTVNYTVGGTKPPVTVKLGSVTLSTKDYKVNYSGNNAPGTGTVTVTGKGSCMGTVSKTFSITSGDLSKCRTSFADKMVSNKAKKYAQKPTIKDTNGKKLKAGRDYERNFVYKYAEDTRVKQKVGKNSYIEIVRTGGSYDEADQVDNKDIIPAGTTIRVYVTGKGNYAGTVLEGSFKFGTKKVSSLKFSIPNQKFTGSRILPGKDMISVKNMTIDDASKCYEIVSYGTNIKTGKGSVTVRGKGAYIGTKTIKFKITK